MYVVSKEKIWHLPEEAIKELDEVYKKRVEQEKKVFLEMEQLVSSLDLKGKYMK